MRLDKESDTENPTHKEEGEARRQRIKGVDKDAVTKSVYEKAAANDAVEKTARDSAVESPPQLSQESQGPTTNRNLNTGEEYFRGPRP